MASAFQIRLAARAMRAGGVIAYPTETVYGLGCDPLNLHAVERLLDIKKRPQEKGLILIGANLAHVLPYINVQDQTLLDKITTHHERPTTWICPIASTTPHWLSGKHHSIAIRISRSPLAQTLCNAFGSAIISTSANPSGHTPAASALQIKSYFQNQLDITLHGQCSAHAKPSRIIDLINDRVIRE